MEKPLGTKTSVIYKVETTWPDKDKPEEADVFSSRYSSAYTLDDDPGSGYEKLATIRRPDLFGKRVTSDSLHFATAEDAHAVADLLSEHGRMTSGWTGVEEWRKNYRGSIKARVVLEIVTTHRELVTK